MPSLRRTLSTPSVRSSPYSYPSSSSSSSSSAANAHATRAGPHQPRRSSGSDTNNRRVLADLDWWVVQDGQREYVGPSPEQEESQEHGAAENAQVRTLGAHVPSPQGVDPSAPTLMPLTTAAHALGSYESQVLSSPLWDLSFDGSIGTSSPQMMSPLAGFAALSVGPRTPLRRSASESSDSSVDSSPAFNSSSLLPTYMDVLNGATPAYPSVFASGIAARRPTGRSVPITSRSVSYSAVEFRLSTARVHDDRFEDIVPSPPPFFSSTMGDSDIDDLFYE
ncbi:uncharacterized protein BXZ73DRAFT_72782 [Epithele typhae]|uniref:uncharacterized protein n=1 Tax=Epithele typhae TaxID=378194 RepID=UPI00200737CC|nr:uncharacterized protein BXZ73DRAFT_72782 [Epithele typhae]KAH9945881.1 hypothetical protein BXZ73DRAFT_72782 [Epithele typhae]